MTGKSRTPRGPVRRSKAARSRPGKGRGRRGAAPAPSAPPRSWGFIAATVAVVVFAGAVIGYAAYQARESGSRTPEGQAAAAREIDGVTVKDYPSRDHKPEDVAYDQSPPFGGPHDQAWADCAGTVYESAIRNENAVHSLEHGAIWVTYRPDLPADQVDVLRRKVEGTDYRMLSPFPGLTDAVSLQSWGYQLKVGSVSDERIDRFFDRLTQNSSATPEYGASCTNPQFKANPRAPGTPVGGAPAMPGSGG